MSQQIECSLNNTINLHLLLHTLCHVISTQNGDRIVAIDSVTSLHPMYSVLGRLKEVCKNKHISLPIKVKLYETSVMATMLYSAVISRFSN